MMQVYLSIIALALMVMCPVYYIRMTRAYVDEVRRLERQVTELAAVREDLDIDLVGIAAQEDELNKQKTALIEEAQAALPKIGGQKEKYKTPQEYLLAAGIIKPEHIAKATRFKEGSKSPYDLGEILVMMDTISPADLSLAKAKVGS